MERFQRAAARPPRLWQQVVLVLFAVGATLGLAESRGWAVGVVAALVYGGAAVASIRSWERMVAWSATHPVLDSALFGPLLFLALAYITNLSTAWCLVLAVTLGVAFVGFVHLLRRRHPSG